MTGVARAPESLGRCREFAPFPAWILKSKVEPQEQLVSLVDRPRLIQRLDGCRKRKLTLISAAAGFGKSSLLGQWRSGLLKQGVKVAWLSVDEDDNEPGVLATYLAFALHSTGLSSAIEDMSETDFGARPAVQ